MYWKNISPLLIPLPIGEERKEQKPYKTFLASAGMSSATLVKEEGQVRRGGNIKQKTKSMQTGMPALEQILLADRCSLKPRIQQLPVLPPAERL